MSCNTISFDEEMVVPGEANRVEISQQASLVTIPKTIPVKSYRICCHTNCFERKFVWLLQEPHNETNSWKMVTAPLIFCRFSIWMDHGLKKTFCFFVLNITF